MTTTNVSTSTNNVAVRLQGKIPKGSLYLADDVEGAIEAINPSKQLTLYDSDCNTVTMPLEDVIRDIADLKICNATMRLHRDTTPVTSEIIRASVEQEDSYIKQYKRYIRESRLSRHMPLGDAYCTVRTGCKGDTCIITEFNNDIACHLENYKKIHIVSNDFKSERYDVHRSEVRMTLSAKEIEVDHEKSAQKLLEQANVKCDNFTVDDTIEHEEFLEALMENVINDSAVIGNMHVSLNIDTNKAIEIIDSAVSGIDDVLYTHLGREDHASNAPNSSKRLTLAALERSMVAAKIYDLASQMSMKLHNHYMCNMESIMDGWEYIKGTVNGVSDLSVPAVQVDSDDETLRSIYNRMKHRYT